MVGARCEVGKGGKGHSGEQCQPPCDSAAEDLCTAGADRSDTLRAWNWPRGSCPVLSACTTSMHTHATHMHTPKQSHDPHTHAHPTQTRTCATHMHMHVHTRPSSAHTHPPHHIHSPTCTRMPPHASTHVRASLPPASAVWSDGEASRRLAAVAHGTYCVYLNIPLGTLCAHRFCQSYLSKAGKSRE